MALAATVGACVGSPIKRCGSGASGCRGVIVEALSHGLASTNFWPDTHCLQSGSSTAMPLRANLSREEPDAGHLHVRDCEGCALQARRTQPSEMAAAAKPSEQPRTESCVASGNGRCEA